MNTNSCPITKQSAKVIPKEKLRDFYIEMTRIREFEEKTAQLVSAGEIRTPCHLYIGQEAIAVGVCKALQKPDYVWGTHRSHGHYLAKGGSMKEMMAEIFGKQGGCSRGKGGSMHLCAPEVGILGTVPIVAATIPMAVGSALACQLRKDGRVSVAFFGDGAVDEGAFHEAMNFAGLKKLPLIFVCENNFYSSHLPLHERHATDAIYKRAESYGMPGVRIDGNNVIEMYEAAKKAVARARKGAGPTLIEARTYRWRGHVGANYDLELGIREKSTLEQWMERCPIKSLSALLVAKNIASQHELDEITRNAKNEVARALTFAQKSPFPKNPELFTHIFKT